MTDSEIVSTFFTNSSVVEAKEFFAKEFNAFHDPTFDFVSSVNADQFFVRLAFRSNRFSSFFAIFGIVASSSQGPRITFFFAPDKPVATTEAQFRQITELSDWFEHAAKFVQKSA